MQGGAAVLPPQPAADATAEAAGDEPAKKKAAGSPPNAGNRVMEEIVVTATKREENIQEVPIAISAFSGEKLDALGVQSAEQLPKITPGLTFTNSAAYTQVYLRGVGNNAFLPSADPDVPFYLDGVALIPGHGISTTLGRVSRVEVLKGPQGTLFGRNSTGGAISIITPDPKPDLEGDIKTEIGNLGELNALVFLNVPIIDGLAATISGYSESHDPYLKDTVAPTLATYSRGGRLKVLWHATEDLSFNLSAMYGEESSNIGTAGENTRVAPEFAAILPQQSLSYRINENVIPGSVNYSQLYSAGVDWRLPWTELKLILSDQKQRNPYEAYDYDATPVPLLSFNSFNEFFNQGTAEFQILSTHGTPLSKYFSWVGGAYYLEANGGFPSLNLQIAQGARAAGVLSALPALDGLLNGINGLLSGLGQPPIAGVTGPITAVSGGLISARSFSGYFQGTIHVQDIFDLGQQINVVLGARLDHESRGLGDNRLGVDNPLTTAMNEITLLPFHVPKATALQVPLKLELQWFPVDETQIYAAFSRGFTAPTYSTVNFFSNPPKVNPEKVDSYEVGLKTQMFEKALTFNAAAFQIYEHQILTGFAGLTSGGVVEFDNAPAGRIRGLEADFTLVPLRALDPGLVVLGSASYLHAKYTNYPNGRGYDPNTGLAFGPPSAIFGVPVTVVPARNFSGHDIDRTPHFSYNVGINQSIELNDNSRVELNVATNYSDGYFNDPQNAPQYAISSFQLLDASGSYFYQPWGVEITAWGKNLTKTLYAANTFLLDTGRQQSPNDPRTFGLRFKYTF